MQYWIESPKLDEKISSNKKWVNEWNAAPKLAALILCLAAREKKRANTKVAKNYITRIIHHKDDVTLNCTALFFLSLSVAREVLFFHRVWEKKNFFYYYFSDFFPSLSHFYFLRASHVANSIFLLAGRLFFV